MFVPFLIFLVFVGLVLYTGYLNSPKKKGERGEKYVAGIISGLPRGYTVLNDIVLMGRNGSTQIDHIVVSVHGIFTIETKNYRGNIYGRDDQHEWKQVIVTDVTYSRKWWKTYTYVTKNKMYNPVRQSVGHALAIKEKLGSEYRNVPVVPIVAFTEKADLSGVHSKHHVIYASDLVQLITSYRTIYMKPEDIETVSAMLKGIDRSAEVPKEAHAMSVRYKKWVYEEKINSGICPECGGHLVKRNGRYGEFVGCSNYPKCRFTKND